MSDSDSDMGAPSHTRKPRPKVVVSDQSDEEDDQPNVDGPPPSVRESSTPDPTEATETTPLPSPDTLSQCFAGELSCVEDLPVWSHLIATDPSDRTTWHLPVRGQDGRINLPLLRRARNLLATGMDDQRRPVCFKVDRVIRDRVQDLFNVAWPGLPPVTIVENLFTPTRVEEHPRLWLSCAASLTDKAKQLLADMNGQRESPAPVKPVKTPSSSTTQPNETKSKSIVQLLKARREKTLQTNTPALVPPLANHKPDPTTTKENEPDDFLELDISSESEEEEEKGDQQAALPISSRPAKPGFKSRKRVIPKKKSRSAILTDLQVQANVEYANRKAQHEGFVNIWNMRAAEASQETLETTNHGALEATSQELEDEQELEIEQATTASRTTRTPHPDSHGSTSKADPTAAEHCLAMMDIEPSNNGVEPNNVAQQSAREGDGVSAHSPTHGSSDTTEPANEDANKENDQNKQHNSAPLRTFSRKSRASPSNANPFSEILNQISRPSPRNNKLDKNVFDAATATATPESLVGDSIRQQPKQHGGLEPVDVDKRHVDGVGDVDAHRQTADEDESSKAATEDTQRETPNEDAQSEAEDVDSTQSSADDSGDEDEPVKRKPGNSLYKRLLEEEIRQAKRLKRMGNVLENEAEEEEEDAAVGNYGDANSMRAFLNRDREYKQERDISERITNDDLDAIVDTYSDDEGEDDNVDTAHRGYMMEQDDKLLNMIKKDVEQHKLGQRAGRRGAMSRVDRALHEDDSDGEESDEEEEMAKLERYRQMAEQRKQDIESGKAQGDVAEVDEELEQQSNFLRRSKMELARQHHTKRIQAEKRVQVAHRNLLGEDEDSRNIMSMLKRSVSLDASLNGEENTCSSLLSNTNSRVGVATKSSLGAIRTSKSFIAKSAGLKRELSASSSLGSSSADMQLKSVSRNFVFAAESSVQGQFDDDALTRTSSEPTRSTKSLGHTAPTYVPLGKRQKSTDACVLSSVFFTQVANLNASTKRA